MDDHLTDQQRADQVMAWLRENGLSLVGGVVLGLAGLYGWRQWQSHGVAEAEQAAALYGELLTAIRSDHPVRADELAVQLARDFSSTPYVDQARLAMAKLKLDQSAPDEAVKYLQDTVQTGRSAELRSIARLRLARVLLQQEKYEDALKDLDAPSDSAFAARFHEVRGDVLVAMGKPTEARSEYQEALKDSQPGVIDNALVQAKLDDLAVPGSVAEVVPAAPSQAAPQPAPQP